MFHPETLVIVVVEEDLLTRPDIACCKDVDLVMSSFRTDIGLIVRGECNLTLVLNADPLESLM